MDAPPGSRHPLIRGERASLRAVSDGDLDLLAGWFAEPEVFRWWGGRALSREEVAAEYTGQRSPDVESFIVEVEGKPVGYLQFWRRTEKSGGLDMFLVPEARGHGLGPEAARAAVQYLLRERRWDEVTVDPFVDDPRAIRAWGRAGFVPEGQERDEETGRLCQIMVVRRRDLQASP